MNMNSKTESLLENLCRTCMEEGEGNKKMSMFDRTERIEDNITIMELLASMIPELNIKTDDMLPKILCENCLERLIDAYEFQKKCLRNEEKLRKMLNECCLEPQALIDPLNDSAVVKQTINDLTDIFKTKSDDPLVYNDKPLVDMTKEDEVKFATEENHWSSDGSAQSDDNDISNEDSDCELDTTGALKAPANVEQSLGKSNNRSESSNNEDKSRYFECDECGSRVKTRNNLKRHKKIHLRPPPGQDTTPPQYKCDFCDKAYRQRYTLTEHLRRHTGDVNSNNDDKNKYFECDECGSRVKNLKRHKKIHLRLPGEKSTPLRYKCDLCEKAYRYIGSLQEHQRTHNGDKPFLCSECGKAFHRESSLKDHYRRHKVGRNLECPICPKKFRCYSDWASHKLRHDDKRPCVCKVCGKGFALPHILKCHEVIHTNERKFKCDYCDKRFHLNKERVRHTRTHTGERPYKCKYCGRAFAQSNDRNKHLRIHVGDNIYRCDYCPQGFRLQRDLLLHLCTHKNEDEETRARNLQALKDEEQRIVVKGL